MQSSSHPDKTGPVDSPPPALSFCLIRALERPAFRLHYDQIRARRSPRLAHSLQAMLTIPPEPRNAFPQEG